MFFGDKKQNQNKAATGPAVEATVIPEEFYGGANPVVKFRETEKIISLTPVTPTAQIKAKSANLFSNRKILILGGLILFVIFMAGGGLYYWWQARQAAVQPAAPIASEVVIPTTPIAEEITPTTTPLVPSEEATSTTSTTEIPPQLVNNESLIEFPSRLLGESMDFDNDQISDAAEEIFKTDPANPDTDGDKYPDGHEVYYLYNPAGFEPQKLIDSGLVKEFDNPTFGYAVYYPADWAVGSADKESRLTLFSAITGENIEVSVFDFKPGETFAEWFGRMAPKEKLSDLVDFVSVFKAKGKKRNDGLVYYFPEGQRLYALIYHPSDSQVINFKIVLEMMARSFRPPVEAEATAGENNAIPPQPVLVQSPTTTATGTSAE